jgi:phospholipase C
MVPANPIKIMKPRQLFSDLVKRSSAALTAAAIFVGPTGITFATPPNHERQNIVTYDENGGRWDHVAPPVQDDGWGIGTRVPAIIISPLARRGYIDRTEYETVSILKFLEFRFNLAPLAVRDADPDVNDLVDAFTQ